MIGRSIRAGWAAAVREKKVVALVWFCNLALSLAAGWAVWRWFGAAFNTAPEGDKLLDGFNLPIIIELFQYDRFSPYAAMTGAITGLSIAALLLGPAIAGGIYEVFAFRDGRPVLHRFGRGAGHFYGRFLRLTAIALVVGVVVAGIVSAILGAVATRIDEAGFERTWVAARYASMAITLLAFLFAIVVLDFARVRVVLEDGRGMLRTYVRALRFVLANAGALFVVYAGIVVTFGIAGGVVAWIADAMPGRPWAGIVTIVLLQQVAMIVRAGFRVARAGASLEFVAAVPHRAPVVVVETPQPAAVSAD
ncbi:MAG TPA: hypothetical protein VFS57_01425 [Gemmatimonadaceae bacterium]|nr:hypothetical protein [Gemmatimonadaceae bacterium]